MQQVRKLGYHFLIIFSMLGVAAALLQGASAVQIESSVQSPMVQFARKKLEQALQAAHYSTPSSVSGIRLGIEPGKSGSYSIQNSGGEIDVKGGDDRGLMYGTLRLAEEVRLGVKLDSIRGEFHSPFIGIRAFKYNLPLPSTLYLSHRDLENHKWFWNIDYWRSFLNTLAEDRYNGLEFWSAEPWSEMIRLKSYPESSSLSPQRLEQNIRFFRKIFRMAKDRGISTYVITWNIDLSPSFAKAHRIPERNVNSLLVRNYLQYCVKTLFETYPNLTGLGTTQGEQMGVIPPSKRATWIADVYFRGIEASGRHNVPFILRYWGGTPADTEKAAAMYHSGPIYLDIKYNGEHVYSSTQYHIGRSAWLKQRHVYKILWHLRNDDIYTLRWGNPEFVRELMVNLKATHAAGFSYGSEVNIPGRDNYDTPSWDNTQTSKYEFQKQWFMFALWGRLAYDPGLPNSLWRRYFRVHYGPAGDALFDSTVAAGRLAPLMTSFHWNYMNGDWYVAGSIGSWNTSSRQPRFNYRRLQMYHGIRTYIFNNTIDSTLENIPSYAARFLTGRAQSTGVRTPLDVANSLEWDGDAALRASKIQKPGSSVADAFLSAQSDDEAYGYLALYYAAKIRAATDLSLFLFSNMPSYKADGIEHLKVSLADWDKLVGVTRKHYLPREIWLFGRFHWSLYTSDVRKDITIAEHMAAFQPETQTWQVAKAAETGPHWKTIALHNYNSFSLEGLHSWLVYANQQFNQGLVITDFQGASEVLWKQQIEPPTGHQLVIEFVTTKMSPAVKVNGKVIEPVSHAIRGITIYMAGHGGRLEITAPAGLVPQESTIASEGPDNRIEVSAGQAAKINSPLVRTAAGAIRLPTNAHLLPRASQSMVVPQIYPTGEALYTIRVPTAGFYKISCRTRDLNRSGRVFHVAVDSYHGPGGVISGKPSTHWKWFNLSQTIALGAGTHSVEIWFLEPGAELGRIWLEAVGSLKH